MGLIDFHSHLNYDLRCVCCLGRYYRKHLRLIGFFEVVNCLINATEVLRYAAKLNAKFFGAK